MNLPRLFRLIGAKKRHDITFFPPWWLLNIKILENRDNWRHVRIQLPLGFFTRNMAGHMFGGSQASLADPIAAIACAHIFPNYSVWTRAQSIDFRATGDSDLELRFDFAPELEARIRTELQEKGRSTPVFEFGFYRTDGVLCSVITNTVAIRPKGYRSQQGAYTAPDHGEETNSEFLLRGNSVAEYKRGEKMNSMKIAAIVLIVAGVLGLAYGSFTYTKETHKADLGPIHLTVKDKETVNVPVWAGVGAIVVGIVLLMRVKG